MDGDCFMLCLTGFIFLLTLLGTGVMSMRVAKLSTLRVAVTNAIGSYNPPTPKNHKPETAFDDPTILAAPLYPPLIDIIIHYAIEDLAVTQLLGLYGHTDNCDGLEPLLRNPTAIAIISRASGDAKTAKEELLIADLHPLRSYSMSTGNTKL
jgi:hypothetical protein